MLIYDFFAFKAHGISLVLLCLFSNIHTQTGYYKKCIRRSVADFLRYTINKHYKKLTTRGEYPNVTWRTSSYLFTYLCLSIDMHWTVSSLIRHIVNLIQLKTFELEFDFAEYIHHTDVRIANLYIFIFIHHTGSN